MEEKIDDKKIEKKILDLILPEYESFKMQPQYFIELNKNDNAENMKREYFQNISLLGERGSGKTNALNKVISYLKLQKNYIVFDLITPETINEEEDLLGWIISLVTEKAEKVLRTFKHNQEFDESCEFNSCSKHTFEIKNKVQDLNKKIKELKESYFLRRSTYNEIIVNDTLSTMEYIEKKSKKLKADTNLKTSFFNLIDELVDNTNDKILIFLFDDVDIYSSKVCEVLKIIMNYLSHKNIVTYIAGDYDSFIENITIELIKKENLLDKDLLEYEFLSNGESAKKIREDRAYEFLKKVLPPKYRYYIKSINNKNKVEIIKVYDKKLRLHMNDEELKSLMNDEIVENIISHIKYGENIVNDYFDFFDDKIRGLTNTIDFVYKEYLNLKKSLATKDNLKLKCNFLNRILECIIHTNINLEKYEMLIRKVINIPNSNSINTEFTGYINYRFIIDEFNLNDNISSKKNIKNYKRFEEIYRIFILSNFFEIALEVLMNRKSSIHGKEELLKLINTLSNNDDGIKLIPNLESVKEVIYLKEKIFENLRYEEIISLFSENNSSNYLRYIYLNTFSNYEGVNSNREENESDDKYIVNTVFKDLIDKDYSWCDKQIKWIYENIFNRKKIIEDFNHNIKMEFKDIDEFLVINSFETEIESHDNNTYINKKYDKFTLDNILNLFNSIVALETTKEKIEKLNKSLEEEKINRHEVRQKIDNIYINLNEKLRKNKTYRKKRFKEVKVIIRKILEILEDKKTKELWESISKDSQVIDGFIEEEELINKLGEEVVKKFIFKEINLDELIEKLKLKDFNIENTKFTLAVLNKNMIFASSEENQNRIINYLKYMMLKDELNKFKINELDDLESFLKELDNEISIRDNDIELEEEKLTMIMSNFQENPIKYLYDEENKVINENIPLIWINQIDDENLKYKKLYLNLSLKKVYEEIKNKTFMNILNLKRNLEQFYEMNKEILENYFLVNNIIGTYIREFKVLNYSIREIRNLSNVLSSLKNDLIENGDKTATGSYFENQVDKLILYINYVLVSENNSVFNLKKNILLKLLEIIVLEIRRIEVVQCEENFNKRKTPTSLEELKNSLDDLRVNGKGCTLKIYLENMGNNEIESVFRNVK